MRNYILLFTVLMMSVLQGCKTDDWMDWKVQNQLLLEANKEYKLDVTDGDYSLKYILFCNGNSATCRAQELKWLSALYKNLIIYILQVYVLDHLIDHNKK